MEASPEASQPVEISPSRIATFCSCPKKHHYTYNLHLASRSRENSKKFDKGNYFHELAHVLYQNIKAGANPGSVFLEETLKNRIMQDLAKIDRPDSDLLKVYDNISKRILRYIREQSPKIDQGITVLEVESELRFTTELGFDLFGYADLLYRKGDDHTVRDHKTGEKMWSKIDVRFHNQNFYYALIYYLVHGVVPRAEINFINTKDYVNKEPPVVFGIASHIYSKTELEIYFEQICKVIVQMLQSEPIPYYGKHCSYCPFQTPCFMERKGIDSSEVIEANFKERDRRHGRFTEENSVENTTDQKATSLPIRW